jgi:hypothetical protein
VEDAHQRKMFFLYTSFPFFSCLEPVAQLKPNFDAIVIGWSSSKIVSGSCALPDTILEEAHPMTILSKFGSN